MRATIFNSALARNSIYAALRLLLLLTIAMQYGGAEARRVSLTRTTSSAPKIESESYSDVLFKTASDVISAPPQQEIDFYMWGEPEKSLYRITADEGMVPGIVADIEKGRCKTLLLNGTSPDLPGVSLGFYSWATGFYRKNWPRGHYRVYLEGFGIEADELRLVCIEKIINGSYPPRYYVSDTLRVFISSTYIILPVVVVLSRICCATRHVHIPYRPQRERLIGPLLPMTLVFEDQYNNLHVQAVGAGLLDFVSKLEAFHLRYRCPIGLYLPDNPVTLGGVNCDLFQATQYLNSGGRTSLRDNEFILPESETWPNAHPLPINIVVRENIEDGLRNFESELALLLRARESVLDNASSIAP